MQNAHIAQTIKLLCKEKGVDIKDFLYECGFSKSFIYDTEKKGASPSCKKITIIAEYFNCSVDYLLGRSNIVDVANDNFSILNDKEKLLIDEFGRLNLESQNAIIQYIQYMTSQKNNLKNPFENLEMNA